MGTSSKMNKLLVIALACALMAFAIAEEPKVEAVQDPPEDTMEDDPAAQGKEELDKMDTNKDGKADLAELTKYMETEFYAPEDIKEEGLTPEQVTEKSGADAKKYLEELDKNKDGALDLEEFTSHYKEDLDQMDEELEGAEEGEEDGDDADVEEEDDATGEEE